MERIHATFVQTLHSFSPPQLYLEIPANATDLMSQTFLDSICQKLLKRERQRIEESQKREERMRRKPRRKMGGGEADRRKIKGEKLERAGAVKKRPHPFESCEQISAVITNKFSTRNEVRKRERVNPKVRPKGVRSYF